MKRRNLTDRMLKALRPAPDGSRYEVMDAIVPGLGVRVSAKGKLTFILLTRYPGKANPARRQLGEYGRTTLEKAREKARDWIELVQKGIDPKSPPGDPEGPPPPCGGEVTFVNLVDDYISKAAIGPNPDQPLMKRWRDVQRALRVEFVNDKTIGDRIRKGLGSRPVGTLVRADIQQVIEDLVARGATTSAHNYLAVVRSMFNWAVDTEKYGLETSPCDRIKPKRLIGERRKRSRFHSDDELTVIWPAAERLGYPFGPVINLLILTGKREAEVAKAKRGEFDLKKREWHIPGPRTKSGAVDVVPLTDTVIAILKSLPTFGGDRKGDYLFSTTFGLKPVSGFSKAAARLNRFVREEAAKGASERGSDDSLPAELEHYVLHDFRRTIRTNLSRLGVPREIAELVIGHRKKGIDAVYDIFEYLDEKRDALRRWESHLARLGLTFHRDSWTYARTPSPARMKAG